MNFSPRVSIPRRPVIHGLDPAIRDQLNRRGQRIELPRGQILFQQNEPGDAFYIVISGRLRVERSRPGLPPMVVGEAGRGQAVGELAVITGANRAATVAAVRHSALLRISAQDFHQIIGQHPEIMRPLLQQVAEILSSSAEVQNHAGAASVVAIGAAHPGAPVSDFTTALAKAMEQYVPSAVLEVEPRETLGRRLETEEAKGITILVPVADDTSVNAFQFADRLLLVADGSAACSEGFNAAGTDGPAGELVRIMDKSTSLPGDARKWLERTGCETIYHIRGVDDSQRLARELTGNSIGLVLGGGGSCAFAHIGAIRAWRERGLPVDRVAGASFGAIIAAQAAAGWSPRRMLEENSAAWNRNRIDREFNWPRTSVLGSRRQLDNLEAMFPGVDIEDLWLPFYCVTANLSQCRLEFQSCGPVRLWVHAGASPPALQPPVADSVGELHIDGGVLDNLPVRAMREAGAGCVAAVNVSPIDELRVEADATVKRPGWWQRLAGRADPRLPNLFTVLYRTATLTSLGTEATSEALADLIVRPDTSRFGLTDYAAIETIEELGYEATRAALDNWQMPECLTGGNRHRAMQA